MPIDAAMTLHLALEQAGIAAAVYAAALAVGSISWIVGFAEARATRNSQRLLGGRLRVSGIERNDTRDGSRSGRPQFLRSGLMCAHVFSA